MPQHLVSSAPRVRTPWGEQVPFAVPIARYGLLRWFCRHYLAGPGRIRIVCTGEADRLFAREIERVAGERGVVVEFVERKLYSMSQVARLARLLPKLDRIVLAPRGLPHFVMAGYRFARETLKVKQLPRVVTLFNPALSSPERNRVKRAVDYMCASGDEIACYARPLFHKPEWPAIVRADVLKSYI